MTSIRLLHGHRRECRIRVISTLPVVAQSSSGVVGWEAGTLLAVRRQRLLLIGASLAVVLAVAAVAAAKTPVRYRLDARCGHTSSPYGALGVYVAEGRLTCAEGAFLIHREFKGGGISMPTDEARYPDGWICGGQMGFYFCFWPWNAPHDRFTKRVYAQACTIAEVGCPARVQEPLS
jgi:hypothetical protein